MPRLMIGWLYCNGAGIPVYQQQLVYAGLELQDEFCLEEYSIPSGAQLKLLIAMRGGPIHAHRGGSGHLPHTHLTSFGKELVEGTHTHSHVGSESG